MRYDSQNLVALYILLLIGWESRKKANEIKKETFSPKKPAEEYAVQIKEISDYLGYIAWSEIYLSCGKDEDAEEVLSDLCYTYPRFPHAFLKLWDLRFRKKQYMESIEPIEELFVRIGDFHTIPEIRVALIPLLYAKTLFEVKQYVFALELLQNEFCKRPVYTVFLYYLGKFALLWDEKFKGTAIGILQECLRSCVSQRKAKILHYLGLAYQDIGQQMTAFDYFEKSSEYYHNKKYMFNDCPKEISEIMKKHMKDHYEISQLRYLIKTKASECKRKRRK